MKLPQDVIAYTYRQVTTMTRVRSRHHILGIEHLLCQLGHCHCAVLLAAAGSKWSKAGHKEVETGERN